VKRIQRLCADGVRVILLSGNVLFFLRRLLFLPDSSCVLLRSELLSG